MTWFEFLFVNFRLINFKLLVALHEFLYLKELIRLRRLAPDSCALAPLQAFRNICFFHLDQASRSLVFPFRFGTSCGPFRLGLQR
jgi:hypothetical protein